MDIWCSQNNCTALCLGNGFCYFTFTASNSAASTPPSIYYDTAPDEKLSEKPKPYNKQKDRPEYWKPKFERTFKSRR
jgi:hypothetical protein